MPYAYNEYVIMILYVLLQWSYNYALLHDLVCFKCSSGKAGELIDRGDNTYGGKFVVNPSGGLISKGHPLGATGSSF